uniref:ankyrin repeat domain-containing protein 33B-like n=1 Tax=Myxine glutinosa TaxID=7769 RepID=UPI00358E17EA
MKDQEETKKKDDEKEEAPDSDEVDVFEFQEVRSILSHDSFFPGYNEIERSSPKGNASESVTMVSFYKACAGNNARALELILKRELTMEEVNETDINGRTGLLVACNNGYVDIVVLLASCPFLDVNHVDNEGQSALNHAAQAGYITITNYLINYYPGLDLEQRNKMGFSALMLAAIQGRSECVIAILLAGAEIDAVDAGRGLNAREWALRTGRWETTCALRRLLERPQPSQLHASYKPEWPQLAARVSEATAPQSCTQKLARHLCSALTIRFPRDPQTGGVLDHLVLATTSLSSPFLSMACRTLCPNSPPAIGTRSVSVPEMQEQHLQQKKHQQVHRESDAHTLFMPTSVRVAHCTISLPAPMLHCGSVSPGIDTPQLKVTAASSHVRRRSRLSRYLGVRDRHLLQVPVKWKFKEVQK